MATQGLLKGIAILGCCVWGLGLVFPNPPRLQAGQEKKPIAARLEATERLFAAGGPVCIRLTLENTSDQRFVLPNTFAIQTRFDESLPPDFPDIVVVSSLRGPRGKVKFPDPQPMLGTRVTVREGFSTLVPGAPSRVHWNITHWPWGISFRNEGTYTLKLRLHFVVSKWLKQQQAQGPWLVAPDALTFLRVHSRDLYDGFIDTNVAVITICVPGPGKNCPKVRKVKSNDPNQVCLQE